jgi:site-specific DNA-methyltransferase (adenine-specific)
MDGMSVIQEKSIDIIVTSPPYNIGIKYGAYNDNLGRNRYLEWMESAGIAFRKTLKDQGSFFLNIGTL